MKHGTDKTGSAKQKVSAIIEGVGVGKGGAVDPTGGMPVKKPSNPMDWNSDAELKPRTGKGTRSY